jgi:diguanylate cyclase (GGDEF)-like protein
MSPGILRRILQIRWAAAFAALLAVVCLRSAFAAAPPEMLFARAGSDSGLSQGSIMAIAQDAQGFLWVGTEDGLDRFDGYDWRHFMHGHDDSGSLPNNWISSIALDHRGRLWIGSDGGGLAWRDAKQGTFRVAAPVGGDPNDGDAKVQAVLPTHDGSLIVGTRGGGLRLFDAAARPIRSYRHDPARPDSLSDDTVFAVREDPSGRVWVGTASGLDLLDLASGHAEHFGAGLARLEQLEGGGIRVDILYLDSRSVLWIGMKSGLARLDTRTGAMSRFSHRDGDQTSMPAGRVTAILEDTAHRLWVGTVDGLVLVDRLAERCTVMRHNPADTASLPDSHVTALFEDRTGLLWVGTKNSMLARWNPRSWSFGHHRFGESAADNVTAFAVDSHGTVWVGSFGAGVAAIARPSGTLTRLRHDSKSPLALRDDMVMALVTDERDRVWIGTMNKGIQRLDPVQGRTTQFDYSSSDPASLPSSGVMSLLRDSRGRIWVGTFGGGLARIDPDTDRVVRYPFGRDDADGLAGDRATALAEDRTGLIWIGTDGSGLDVLDPVTGRFAHFRHDPRRPNSLSANTIYAINADDSGGVWVGTRGGGLDHASGTPFGRDGLSFDNVSEGDGLPNSTIYGIESDASGNLWLSTNRGVAQFRTKDRSIRSFRRSHGLQSDEFNFGAHYRAPDGTLYFGGANGYNAFLPERLQFDERPPTTVLTQILKLEKPASPAPEMLENLNLAYGESVVTFRFAALDFSGPEENRYAYRLEGFDKDWVGADSSRQATYTNLDGGDYVFRVRAANADGHWNETPIALHVRVAPPPWATWWARTLYVCAFVAALACVWMSQQRRLRREEAYARRLQFDVAARTAELAERNRDMERANEQLRAASVSDSLTGLGNRRCLHDAMTALFSADEHASGRPAPRFVLMVIDLDCLKPINDQYGHEGGDAVLIQVAEILRLAFRRMDLIVRWGGDEFVVLCMDADMVVAGKLAERVRATVSKRIFRLGDGPAVRTSCSIGFAPFPFVAENPGLLDWEETLGIADVALYQAKGDRNTWIGWSGTAKIATLPSVPAALAADPAGLEADGYLAVQRRPWSPEETVDMLRNSRTRGPR